MTVEELIARLQEMPPGSKVMLSVPPPGDDYYDLVKVEKWHSDDVILEGE